MLQMWKVTWSCQSTITSTCGKRGHYSKVCKSTKTVHVVETDCNEDTPLFLGSVDAGLDPWFADLTIRNHKVRFKIDTGADVSVIPAHIYHAITEGDSQLVKPDRPLFGPGRMPLSVLGRYSESLCKGEQVIQEEVYVVNDLNVALLSRTASVKPKLVYSADTIDKSEMEQAFPTPTTSLFPTPWSHQDESPSLY